MEFCEAEPQLLLARDIFTLHGEQRNSGRWEKGHVHLQILDLGKPFPFNQWLNYWTFFKLACS